MVVAMVSVVVIVDDVDCFVFKFSASALSQKIRIFGTRVFPQCEYGQWAIESVPMALVIHSSQRLNHLWIDSLNPPAPHLHQAFKVVFHVGKELGLDLLLIFLPAFPAVVGVADFPVAAIDPSENRPHLVHLTLETDGGGKMRKFHH